MEVQEAIEQAWQRFGIDTDVRIPEPADLARHFDGLLKRWADRPAYTGFGHTLTYRELDQLSAHFAAWLQHSSGLKPGDRLAIQMPNLLQYPVAAIGALRAGLVLTNVNPMYTAHELEHQLIDSGAKGLLVFGPMAATAAEVLPKTAIQCVIVTGVADFHGFFNRTVLSMGARFTIGATPRLPGAIQWREIFAKTGLPSYEPVPRGRDDVALLQYTGGTTGRAKGAELTHGNLLANLNQILPLFHTVGIEEGHETFLSALPLYHIYALCLNLMVGMGVGGHSVLVANPRKIDDYPKLFRTHDISMFPGLATMFQALARNPAFVRCDHSSLKVVLSGGMPLSPEVGRQWREVTGIDVCEGYGLTETSPVVALALNHFKPHPGADGMLPLPGQELRIVHPDDQRELPTGEHGELWVRGPQVMAGYWQQPEETAKALRDGWLATGDIGSIDEQGMLRIHDRMKDLVIVSGFNVYPAEVEDMLLQHPKILEAAVVGIKTASGNEEVVAVVVAANPRPTEQEIIEFCRKELTRYKVPRRVVFRDELPKSNVGKVLRKPLREELQKAE